MNRLQQRKLTRQEPDPNPNARHLCTEKTGLLLAWADIGAWLSERDIGERDTGERDIGEDDIGEEDVRGEGHRGDCRHLPNCAVSAVLHRHPRYLRPPQLLPELALLGDIFAASQVPTTAAH